MIVHNAVNRGWSWALSYRCPVNECCLKLHLLWDLFKLNQLCVVCGADFVSLCVECKLIACMTD